MHARVPPAVFQFDVFSYCVYDEVDAKKGNSVEKENIHYGKIFWYRRFSRGSEQETDS